MIMQFINIIRAKVTTILATLLLLLASSANAIPVIDGFASTNEYSNMLSVQWYNDHNSDGTQFPSGGGQMTAVYYDWYDTTDELYLYLEAPLSAKNMIWGDGWTEEEALYYYQHWCSPTDGPAGTDHDGSTCEHHDKGFEEFFEKKGDYKSMTGSEKTKFAGIEANLAGDIKNNGGYNIVEYMDSVDYVIGTLGCDTVNCDANETPMAFEFLFSDFDSMDDVDSFLTDITSSGVVFHLSPERGGPGSSSNVPTSNVSEPSTFLLLALSLILLSSKRRFKT